MSRHAEDADPVPQFAKQLAPYVKPRQEVLKIRRALTLYLRNQVVFSEANAASHLSLSTSYNVVGVKRIPKEITGLRKEYLRAIQENAAAKKAYDDLVQDVEDRNKETEAPATHRLGSGQELQTYRALLHDRRRREKLQIFHHYLEELDRKQAARPNYLNIQGDQKLSSNPPNFDGHISQANGGQGGTGEDLETIIHNLEKAVIRAKQQLDSEKGLLEGLKRSSEGRNIGRDTDDPRMKIEALQRTQHELVNWVEERLSSSASEDLDQVEGDDLPDSAVSFEDRKMEIKEQYEAYVEARKRLLASASMTPPQALANEKAGTKNPDDPAAQSMPFKGSLGLLPYTNDVLLPLYNAQKALGLQKSHISGVMAREKSSTCRTLDRLHDESHLIPSYPILSKQPRFQHAVTAIKSRSMGSISPEQSAWAEDEVVSHAQAWAFASEAARGNTRDYIEERIAIGSEAADNAEEILKEVYDIMNQDHSETIYGDNDKQEESDIWTADVKPGKSRGRAARPEKPKGPFSGLNGKIGLG